MTRRHHQGKKKPRELYASEGRNTFPPPSAAISEKLSESAAVMCSPQSDTWALLIPSSCLGMPKQPLERPMDSTSAWIPPGKSGWKPRLNTDDFVSEMIVKYKAPLHFVPPLSLMIETLKNSYRCPTGFSFALLHLKSHLQRGVLGAEALSHPPIPRWITLSFFFTHHLGWHVPERFSSHVFP